MKIINLVNYESFSEFYRKYELKELDDLSLILLFVGSDDPQESWCSDCRFSKPVVDKVIEKFQYNEQLILATVHVGLREDWKDNPQNPFRLHPLKISAVPTLLSLRNVSVISDNII